MGKANVTFGIRICQNVKNCTKRKKKVNLGPKMPYLGILGWKFEKLLSYLKNQHPRICHNAKFRAKLKILNLGAKNAWFSWFCCESAVSNLS